MRQIQEVIGHLTLRDLNKRNGIIWQMRRDFGNFLFATITMMSHMEEAL